MMSDLLTVQHLLKEWPHARVPVEPWEDSTSERLRQTLFELQHNRQAVGSGDLAGLLRQWFRERQLEDPTKVIDTIRVPRAPGWPSPDLWRSHGCIIERETRETLRLRPQPWHPEWLGPGASSILEPVLQRVRRRQDDAVPADPSIREQFGFQDYLSSGQREAVRAVFLMAAGATLTIALPTGSGKSVAFLAPALSRHILGTVVVVTPTVSLALDFEQRVHELDESTRRTGLAYHSGLNDEERTAIRKRLRAGSQPIVFASPESLLGSLRMALLDAARDGYVPYLFVDEAHLVSQWGQEFRPQFQTLAGLRRAIMACSPAEQTLRTVLMTATLTPSDLRVLETLFDAREEHVINYPLIRPEPDYWLKKASDSADQDVLIGELVRFAPRPFILYTTRVEHAKNRHQMLRAQGMQRIGLLHGKSRSDERRQLVARWRRRELDGVVATSAFGLGVDQSDVRTVIHACVPETADRYYQEVGRAGRDGRASLSFVIYTEADHKDAENLNRSRLISIERGLERWDSMLQGAQALGNGRAQVSLESRPSDLHQDTDANVAWNMRTLILMARAGLIRLDFALPPDNLEERSDTDVEQCIEQYFRTVEVEFLHAGHCEESVWEQAVAEERSQSKAADKRLLEAMEKILSGEAPVGALLSEIYHLPGQERPEYVRGVCAYDRNQDRLREGWYPAPEPRPLLKTQQKVAPELTSALHASSGTILVPYNVSAMAGQWRQRMLHLVRHLVRQGVQEVIADDEALSYWATIHHASPAGFVVTRRFGDIADEIEAPELPAVSVVGPASGFRYLAPLARLKRPIHLLIVPAHAPDPERSDRAWKDVFQPVVPFSLLFDRLTKV
jgi:ATP-dependent DNA helicase RecQ